MNSKEKEVRDLASKLSDAIDAARKAGLAVDWPRTSSGLKSIGISETKDFAAPKKSTNSDKTTK